MENAAPFIKETDTLDATPESVAAGTNPTTAEPAAPEPAAADTKPAPLTPEECMVYNGSGYGYDPNNTLKHIKITKPSTSRLDTSTHTSVFEKVKFALKAISKDRTRYALNTVCIYDGMLCCSDGHRLHIVEDIEFDNGLYEVAVNTAKQILLIPFDDSCRYPDIKMIVSTSTENYGAIKTDNLRLLDTDSLYFLTCRHNYYVDPSYFKDAISTMTTPAICMPAGVETYNGTAGEGEGEVRDQSFDRPLYIEDTFLGLKAIVMPKQAFKG